MTLPPNFPPHIALLLQALGVDSVGQGKPGEGIEDPSIQDTLLAQFTHTAPPEWTPGERLRYRPFFSHWKNGARAKLMLVYIRLLNLEDKRDIQRISDIDKEEWNFMANPDCLVGYFQADKGIFMVEVADSSHFTLWPKDYQGKFISPTALE